MIIWNATESDLTAIIALLRNSLGENLIPKSEGYWRWKHIENPFGESPVLVCQAEGGGIVGVRAFMQWTWVKDGKEYRALRAVDTATHPDYQGKGIFKRLTLDLVKQCAAEKFDFIFNTPNASSRPGYLKMGWRVLGRLKVRISPSLTMISASIGQRKNSIEKLQLPHNSTDLFFENREQVEQLIAANNLTTTRHLKTSFSFNYLKWRYNQVPIEKYYCINNRNEENTICIFFRTKSTKYGMEGRITDILVDRSRLSEQTFMKGIKQLKTYVDFVSVVDNDPLIGKMLSKSYFLPQLPIGPIITIRDLTSEDSSFLLNFNVWKPTLGDLELF